VFTNYPDSQDEQHRYDQLFPAIEKRMTDQQGNLWFSSPSGLTLVNFVDHPMRLLPVEPTKPTRSVVCRRDGTIWAGSAGGNIVVYGSDGRPKGWLTPQGSISSSPARFSAYIYALYEDRHGNLWIGTRGQGIYRLAANGNAVGHYQHNLGDPYSLSHDIVYDFDEDEQGRLWMAVGLGRTVFYEKIRELVGVSPSDFLKQVRMQRACQLLAKSRLSVAEVAYAIGFTDPKYFTKCFKKDTGMTPTEYRTSKQNQQ
jgi:ligand-binding sensor domain-containing protein